ncbi:MAG: ABC-2 transporter permease [Clostridia bacterium]|nr:ABC-2 transporter permease [Clostridia bacterium]
MLGLIKKDFSVVFSSKSTIIFLLLYIPLLLFVVDSYQSDFMYMAILFFYTYMFVITPFSYDITYKTIYMMNSLPITKKETVVCRYLSVFIYFILSIVYSTVYLWIINVLGISDVDYFNLGMIKKVLPIILVSISVIFPIYLKFPYNIARIAQIMIVMVFFIFLANPYIMNRLAPVLNVNMYIASSILYVISLLISIKLYESRDW